ncbi:MAG: Eco57I restriction-modification methylase domain-containing protein, partial [Candidatus Poribacteria bacterium]|nr:Eco57I restriction-modification methylase domain-containing protein [Candidatus Poribacteria bacterium]
FRKHAESVKLVFQFTSDEVTDDIQQKLFESEAFDKGNIKSFLFCAVELKDNTYSRTKYAEFTREINKRLFAPTVILFRAGNRLTVAFADRRPDKTDEDRDVLGQVTLIKDIRLNNPHRAHLDILSELSLEECVKWIDEKQKPKNFDGLLSAWLAKLDTEELNKQFYRKLFAWYEWAIETATFPTDENRTLQPEEHIIRLITRLLFIWFIKEKRLVTDALFNKAQIQDLLKEDDFDNGDAYYRAVLQNLFFATLNTEIDKRKFSTVGYATNRDFSRYRYKDQMRDSDRLLELFGKTPFINGGLFDCLDSWEATGKESYRIDCFSDNQYHKLSIPNRLFFDTQQGLIPLLEHYKFTVEENTPIEQEVALDPELLGRVFENLLAAYNPETGATVRKQTGSYYTPRAIVDYMVEEALVATLSQKCNPTDGDAKLWDERLHYLLDYAQAFDDANEWFDDVETDAIVRAISELKILDPAVGSGAFPMGMLHKLTLALRRLDPDNTRWEKLQKERAVQRAEVAFDTQDDEARREELVEIDETFKRYRNSDFGRKLYLIQNSIFGIDIQSVACQIAKLRFFISLAIEQEPEQNAENFGIKPLPNLETRFIAANTLIGLKAQGTLTSNTAQELERALRDNREQHFHATTRQRKRACKIKDEELRAELATELKHFGMPADDAERIARWDPYDQNDSADWFDSEWMFGITEGFDVVIGNPPYIQLQKEGGRLGKLYQNVGFKTFIRTGDIYCLFYEKANQLLKNDGYVCFITSNKWMRAGYGKKLRDYFVTLTQPIQLLDMGPDVFDATVDTNILLFQKIVSNAPTAFVGVSLGADFDRQTNNIAQYLSDNGATIEMPAKGEPWAILSSAELNLKRKIEDVGKPLKDWDIKISFGIKTGCNEAFIIDEDTREEFIEQDPKSAEIIKPLLRGRNIERYNAPWVGLYLISTFPALNLHINDYLAIKNYLIEFGKDRLEQIGKILPDGTKSRKKTGNKWFETQDQIAYYPEFEKEKIVWKRIGSILRFAYIQQPMLCLDSTCIATGEKVRFLTAVLNSRVSHYQLFGLAPKTGTGDLIVSVQALEPLLVPPITKANQHLAEQIEMRVDKILDAKHIDPEADTAILEDEIDKLVYELYNLTEDEIAIVEGSV